MTKIKRNVFENACDQKSKVTFSRKDMMNRIYDQHMSRERRRKFHSNRAMLKTPPLRTFHYLLILDGFFIHSPILSRLSPMYVDARSKEYPPGHQDVYQSSSFLASTFPVSEYQTTSLQDDPLHQWAMVDRYNAPVPSSRAWVLLKKMMR